MTENLTDVHVNATSLTDKPPTKLKTIAIKIKITFFRYYLS